jgi:hypothetical protein
MKKKILISLFAIVCASHGAKAVGVLDSFLSAIGSGSAASALCKKANFWKGSFSIRSLNGQGCNIKLIAAFAESICPGAADDYASSQCHTNAQKVLGADADNPQKVLEAEIAKLISSGKSGFCSKAGNVHPLLAAACAKASKKEEPAPMKEELATKKEEPKEEHVDGSHVEGGEKVSGKE